MKRNPNAARRCERHNKVIFHSVEHAADSATFLARRFGSARIYWEKKCKCYHLTTQPERRNDDNDGSDL